MMLTPVYVVASGENEALFSPVVQETFTTLKRIWTHIHNQFKGGSKNQVNLFQPADL